MVCMLYPLPLLPFQHPNQDVRLALTLKPTPSLRLNPFFKLSTFLRNQKNMPHLPPIPRFWTINNFLYHLCLRPKYIKVFILATIPCHLCALFPLNALILPQLPTLYSVYTHPIHPHTLISFPFSTPHINLPSLTVRLYVSSHPLVT